MSYDVIHADCVEAMREMDEASVDAIVCDPPYELGFMGKAWDRSGIAYQPATWAEALRILKPGGHLLAFGGTRTYHRLACAIEDAGFEIRDSLIYIYGSGFPKSLDVSKAIDKAAGAEREVVGSKEDQGPGGVAMEGNLDGSLRNAEAECAITAPATPEAQQWQGWGTALKPAHEPIVVARKPLSGTVAANVLAHGTGAINVDGCRVEGQPRATGTVNPHAESGVNGIYGSDPRTNRQQTYDANLPAGRWPANVLLDEHAAEELDRQSGELKSPKPYERGSGPTSNPRIYGNGVGIPQWSAEGNYGDTGGASRFFYTAKASRGERNAGLGDAFPVKRPDERDEIAAGHFHEKGIQPQRNAHPTVKPIALMRWLVRLVTPPGGTILDPFLGSGTTGCAAVLEGFDFIGIEREAEYVEIAKARIDYWNRQPVQVGLFEEAA